MARFADRVDEVVADIEARGRSVRGGRGDRALRPGRGRRLHRPAPLPRAAGRARGRPRHRRPSTPAWPSSIPRPRPRSSPSNRRRIIRALEVCLEGSGRPFSSRSGPGSTTTAPPGSSRPGSTSTGRPWTAGSTSATTDQLAAGFLDEVRGPGPPGLVADRGPGPRLPGAGRPPPAVRRTLEEALEEAKRRTRRFARRQQRWFRRDPRIRWFDGRRRGPGRPGGGLVGRIRMPIGPTSCDNGTVMPSATRHPAIPDDHPDQAPRPRQRLPRRRRAGAPLGPDDAVAWCHRREGIGADGLIQAVPCRGRPPAPADRPARPTRVADDPVELRRWPGRDLRQRAALPGPGPGRPPRATTGQRRSLTIETDAGDRAGGGRQVPDPSRR